MAWRMSPSAVKMRAVRPSSLYFTYIEWKMNVNFEGVGRETDLFELAYLQEPLEYLRIAQFGIAQDGTTTLYWLDDLVRHIARECEPCRVGEDLHCSSEGLLRSWCHAGQEEFVRYPGVRG